MASGGGGGGGSIGIIAAGVAVPAVIAACAAISAAAALVYWRMKHRSAPAVSPVATGSSTLNNLTVSPLYEARTQTHVNELYVAEEVQSQSGMAPATKDDMLRANNMSWDRV